jgi:hypothetical protein
MAEYGIILLVVLLGTLSSLTVSSGSLADAIIHLVGRFLGT